MSNGGASQPNREPTISMVCSRLESVESRLNDLTITLRHAADTYVGPENKVAPGGQIQKDITPAGLVPTLEHRSSRVSDAVTQVQDQVTRLLQSL